MQRLKLRKTGTEKPRRAPAGHRRGHGARAGHDAGPARQAAVARFLPAALESGQNGLVQNDRGRRVFFSDAGGRYLYKRKGEEDEGAAPVKVRSNFAMFRKKKGPSLGSDSGSNIVSFTDVGVSQGLRVLPLDHRPARPRGGGRSTA